MEKYRLTAVAVSIFVTIYAEFFFPFLVPQVIEVKYYSSNVRWVLKLKDHYLGYVLP